ncbi:Rhamnolipids biosynthesis 3-oxoacyl-[acyl-carrier-protein] reductase [Exophiala dermatitidis]
MGSAKQDVELERFDSIFSLEGKVAVVSGGSRGLGLNAASGLLQAGCSKVYITSRKAQACADAVAALNALPNKRPGAVAVSVPADSSKIADIERLAAEVARSTDHVDILFANAGTSWGAPIETYPEEAFSKVMDLNKYHPLNNANTAPVQKFAPLFKARATTTNPSRVIVTASIAGLGVGTVGENATYAYSASKAAVIHLAKNLAVGLGPYGVITNAIAPGFYPTTMAKGLMELEGGQATMAHESPNKRLGLAEDMAGLVVFLSSRASAHINGAVITTDGGYVLAKGRL